MRKNLLEQNNANLSKINVNNDLSKEINFEDFFLLNQKFGIIKDNLNLLSNSKYSTN